jgi:hypothetical protein
VTYTVRTAKVAQVKLAMARSGELVRAGVAFAPWGASPAFLYTKLNEDRDSGTPDVRKVRVVTTIEYELRDD